VVNAVVYCIFQVLFPHDWSLVDICIFLGHRDVFRISSHNFLDIMIEINRYQFVCLLNFHTEECFHLAIPCDFIIIFVQPQDFNLGERTRERARKEHETNKRKSKERARERAGIFRYQRNYLFSC
jgi:hypothetical protein